jgi:hypothetical protein
MNVYYSPTQTNIELAGGREGGWGLIFKSGFVGKFYSHFPLIITFWQRSNMTYGTQTQYRTKFLGNILNKL